MIIRFLAGLTVIAVFLFGLAAAQGIISALVRTTISLP